MRNRNFFVAALLALGLVGGLASAPAQAAPKKFEGHLAAPFADAAGVAADELACPEAGDGDGLFYKFFDLEGDYKNFKVSGPTHLFTDPTGGTLGWDSYDLDLYVFDAKCNPLPDANSGAGTEKLETKKPARYAIVHYYYGVIPDLPITLEVDNSPIK